MTKIVVVLGRVLYSLIFLMSGPGHIMNNQMMVGYAAAKGVPMAGVLVPFSGLMALVGGLSVLLGYKAKWGAWLLVLFLLPVTFMLHNFWTITDPAQAQARMMDMIMFMKNLSMLGGALLITQLGSGPLGMKD